MAGLSRGWKALAVLGGMVLLLVVVQLLQGEESIEGEAEFRTKSQSFTAMERVCSGASQGVEETMELQLTLDPGLFQIRRMGVDSFLERLEYHTGQSMSPEETVGQVRWQRYVKTTECGASWNMRLREELTAKGEETGRISLDVKYGHRASTEGNGRVKDAMESLDDACALPFRLNTSLATPRSIEKVEYDQHLCGRKMTRVSRAYLPAEYLPRGMSDGEVSCQQISDVFPDLLPQPLPEGGMATAKEASVWFVHRLEGVRLKTATGSLLHCDLEFTLHYRDAKEASQGRLWPIGTQSTSDSEFSWRVYLSRSMLTTEDAAAARAFLQPREAPVWEDAASADHFLAELLGWYTGLIKDFGSFGENQNCAA